MFNLFKKKSPSFPCIDKIWKTEEAALKGMLMMAMMRIQHNFPALIMSFFTDEHEQMAGFMRENKIAFIQVDEMVSLDALDAPAICIVEASRLSNTAVLNFLSQHAARFGKEIYSPGHFPLTPFEDKMLDALTRAGFAKFIFCFSFSDPLLKMFGGERFISLVERLGVEENESIEHAMVTQAIKRARQKLDEKVKIEKPSTSRAEWFALNVKEEN